ncbi:hypothetical protein BIZ37_26650 [Photobacterium sp. BZF1]|uniref:hypothetical protein n=1 Tax=Photobacterium sp. BZF1 TaxID=1904457 RepID=UPI001653BDB6|nr:hypothetical protein [Photobacterium sp. BZF1]MBC7006145.1 hypothetical protein [Photobacterium sp. BZF1]
MKKVLLAVLVAGTLAGCNDDKGSNTPVDEIVNLDPREQHPYVEPIGMPSINPEYVHDTKTVTINEDNTVSAMVDYADSDGFGTYKGETRITAYVPLTHLVSDVQISDMATPNLDIESDSDWFMNIYVRHEGANKTINLFKDGSAQVRNEETFNSWEEMAECYGDAIIRTNYTENTGFTSVRFGNFMFRSSDTNNVVPGEVVTFNTFKPFELN